MCVKPPFSSFPPSGHATSRQRAFSQVPCTVRGPNSLANPLYYLGSSYPYPNKTCYVCIVVYVCVKRESHTVKE